MTYRADELVAAISEVPPFVAGAAFVAAREIYRVSYFRTGLKDCPVMISQGGKDAIDNLIANLMSLRPPRERADV